MNFDYNDEQKALKDEARRFLSSVAPLATVRAVLDGAGQGYDPALWTRIGDQGWCGAAVPEQYGGTGMGHVELCALAEELGRALAPVPFASTAYLLAEALLLAGSEAQKAELLPKLCTGGLIGALAVAEGPGVLSAKRITTRFAGGKLTGAKLPVTDGLAANRMLVLAMSADGPGLYLCDPTGSETTREPIFTVDRK
ncbi:MAG: acyl-CoA dehydrogenase family protein, partial [Novosphingobium sp.]